MFFTSHPLSIEDIVVKRHLFTKAAVFSAIVLGTASAHAALPTEATTALTAMIADITEVGTYLIPAAAAFAAIGWVVARI